MSRKHESLFLNPCPPLVERHAFRFGRPCRIEEGSQQGSGHDDSPSFACLHEKECEETSLGIPLERIYRGGMKVTMTECSSSIVVRSEHQYSRDDRLRLGLRKHLHELSTRSRFPVILTRGICDAVLKDLGKLVRGEQQISERITETNPSKGMTPAAAMDVLGALKQTFDAWTAGPKPKSWWSDEKGQAMQEIITALHAGYGLPAPAARVWAEHAVAHIFAPLRCHEITPFDAFGRYLGFIDLRLNSMVAPIALGLLVAPRHLRHDERVRYIEGEYSSLFGATGFTSSVYSMHEPELGGALCVQACIITATGLLSDRGVHVPGSFEATYLARSARVGQPIAIGGLRCDETLAILNNDALRSTAIRFHRSADDPYSRRLAERLIEAYVMARCPVLLFVGTKAWYRLDDKPKDCNHCVVIAGFRRRLQEEPYVSSGVHIPVGFEPDRLSDLVIHDPGSFPYALWPLDHCLYASGQYTGDQDRPKKLISLIFTGPKRMAVHAHHCFEQLCDKEKPSRVLQQGTDYSWLNRYFKPQAPGCAMDLRISLVHRDDVADKYFSLPSNIFAGRAADPVLSKERLEDFQKQVKRRFPKHLEATWYWAFEGYQDGRLRTLWLCNSHSADPRCPWEWRFHVYEDGSYLNGPRSGDGHLVAGDLDFSERAIERATEEPFPPQPHPFSAAAFNGNGAAKASATVGELLPLKPSVITSSSNRGLKSMIDEMIAIDAIESVDLYVLRERDVVDIIDTPGLGLVGTGDAPVTRKSMRSFPSAAIMAQPSNIGVVKDWFVSQMRHQPNLRVAALATYYPQIANMKNPDLRQQAIDALANTICMGVELQEEMRNVRVAAGVKEAKRIDNVIVEVVCGSRLDKHDEKNVVEAKAVAKTRFVLDGFKQTVARVSAVWRDRHGDNPMPCRYVLGIELEPGKTYVVQDYKGLKRFVRILHNHFSCLLPYVGVNVDIAHMIMAGVTSEQLCRNGKLPYLKDMLVHAHIADHPRMHTRDQRIGGFMPVDRFEAEEYAFLVDLAEVWQSRSGVVDGLPYSGCVALELEGCGRIGWVHSSIQSLRQMCQAVRNFGGEIRKRQSPPH